MLSLKDIDLDMLTTAMENASYEMQWWLDPDTGELELTGEAVDEGLSPEELEERGSKGSVLSAISRTRYDYPQVQEDWYAFHEKRMRHHAVTWLLSEGLIDEQEARGELGEDS